MGKESFTSSTITTVIPEAPKERTEEAPKQDEAGKLLKELAKKKFPRPGKGTEQNKKSEAAIPNGTNERPAIIRRNLVTATDSKHAGVFDCNNRSQGTGSKKSEAANTNGTNKRPAIIRRNQVKKVKGGHHVGVSRCNNGVQGTKCDIEDNEVTESINSEYVGVSNCGNC